MTTTRRYSMAGRQAAAGATRDAILHAAHELFLAQWYDDVTLAAIAAGAGVSGQTVINHFGGKEQVFAAVIERFSQDVIDRRYSAEPGDVAGAVGVLVDDYELTGDSVVRMLALEDRLPVLGQTLANGRTGHRAWVETMFRAPALTDELVVATDVYAWKLLRRDRGLSRDETAAAIRRIVEALLTTQRTRRSR